MEPLLVVPKAPEVSLSFEVVAKQGQKQIQRKIGSFRSIYVNGSVASAVLNLEPAQRASLKTVKAPLVQTTAEVTVQGIKATSSVTLQVKQLCVLDDEFDTVEITAGAQGARVNVHYQG